MQTSNRVGIRTCSDYSPFGVELDGRMVSGGYRYGFQNQEKDDEFKGKGNSYTTEFRQLDPRLGRWLIVDPLSAQFTSISPYCYAANNPICLIDNNGESPVDPRVMFYARVGTACLKICTSQSNKANRFKGLYLVAQIRAESGFSDGFANNPFNIKAKGDLGRVVNPKSKRSTGKVWASYSTMEKGVQAGVDLMKAMYPNAYTALIDDSKTIKDFANGINKNIDGNAWGTITSDMLVIFKGVVADYEKAIDEKIKANYQDYEFSKQKVDDYKNKLGASGLSGKKDKVLKSLEDAHKALSKRVFAEYKELSEEKKELQEFKENEGIK
ncbi:MAG: hypothetical protein RL207_1015 [Bacteroidota bacterium]